MSTEADFEKLKRTRDRLQSEVDQSKGALEETMSRLKKDFGCYTLQEAEKLLKKTDKELDKATEEFEEAMAAFQKEWGDDL